MEINKDITNTLKKFSINISDGVTYLISLYFKFDPTYIPETLKRKINLTGIFEVGKNGIDWKIPLFEGQETEFDWVVKEYLPIFAPYGTDKKHKRECVTRMKDLFSRNPSIRKHEVLGATKLYIQDSLKNGSYVRLPHYFIFKDKGASSISDMLTWIEIYKEKSENSEMRTSKERTIQ